MTTSKLYLYLLSTQVAAHIQGMKSNQRILNVLQ